MLSLLLFGVVGSTATEEPICEVRWVGLGSSSSSLSLSLSLSLSTLAQRSKILEIILPYTFLLLFTLAYKGLYRGPEPRLGHWPSRVTPVCRTWLHPTRSAALYRHSVRPRHKWRESMETPSTCE